CSAATATVAAGGDVYLRTGWSGAVDLGGGAISAATNDTVVARYAPPGAYVWGRDFPLVRGYPAGVDGRGSLDLASMDGAFDPGQGKVLPQSQPAPPTLWTPLTAIVKYAP